MKRFSVLSLICLTLLAAIAPLSSASADPHGDRFKRDCKSGARKC